MPTTVLLCDTADEVARFQYHLLREHDLEVEVTTDAFRGIEAAVRSRPDVIVSELTLEGLGGAELVKRFLASSPTSRPVGSWRRSRGRFAKEVPPPSVGRTSGP
jgi:CheY-like chemotaxis protein